MGLRETFQSAAKSAITAMGNVAVSTNYQALSSTTYNASAGTNQAAFATTAGVSVVFDVFRIDQVDGVHIRPEDKQALIPAKSISTVTPDVQDRIVHGGDTWHVVNVSTDPAEALWVLQVRRS